VIVVDTNVVVPLWIDSPATETSEALLTADAEWCVPLLWRSEFRNTLLGYVRRRALPLEAAAGLLAAAEEHLQAREFAVESVRVLRRAAASRCSAYDCEFVVLAEELGVPLVTHDREILDAFPRVAVSPRTFLERHRG